ncbi:hypothetical protein HPP92_021651 [Vanilla planifolia]|uniref:Uncharacterized protein n=1 Tax=Vanilla planifolia TaxID=51239 RepID=A0A835Q1J6_VANPL|nr:hypothetical protein HPP92_021651 [Vanilla planifolia]
MDFLGITCPQTFTNTTINSTLFDFSDNDRNLTVYVGCLITLPIDFSEIQCLGPKSYYKLQKAGELPVDTFEICTLKAAVPVNQAAAAVLNGSRFGEALQMGFDLTWRAGKEWARVAWTPVGCAGMIETSEGNSHNGLIIGLGTAGD